MTAPKNPNKQSLKLKKQQARLAGRIADYERTIQTARNPQGYNKPGSGRK